MTSTTNGELPDNPPENPTFVLIYCVLSASQVFVKGSVSGREYLFHGGKPVPVDTRDIPELIKHKSGHRVCCRGNENDRKMFIQIQEE